MKKLAAGVLIFSLSLPQMVNANPTAGAMDGSAYTNYENVTQYVFQNYDIWNDAEPEEQIVEEAPIFVSVWDLSDWEREFLKQTIMAECGYNQPDECVRATTDVILNRVRGGWATDIYGVVTQQNQFETWSNGKIQRQWNISEQVDRIVEEELMYGQSYPGVLYFTTGYYNPYCTPLFKIGGHYFGY